MGIYSHLLVLLTALDDANAAADELQVKFDTEREVKYVGIIFMHCDTL